MKSHAEAPLIIGAHQKAANSIRNGIQSPSGARV